MKINIYLSVILSLIFGAKCGNILVIHVVPTTSYSNVIEAIINVLATEHQITFLSMAHTHYDHPNVTLSNLKRPNINYMKEFSNIFEKMMKQDNTNDAAQSVLFQITPEYIKGVLANEAFENLLKTKIKYDMLITFTSLSEYVFPFAQLLNIPLVQVASSFVVPWQNEAIGNPNYLSIDNGLFVSGDSDSFYGRLINYFNNIKLLIRYKYIYIPRSNEAIKTYFPSNISNIETISKNTSLLIANTHYTMNYPRPTLANMIEIGGLHCKKQTKKLPNNLEQFINEANETGLIYVSFGSTIPGQFPQSLLNSFVNVFRKIPQRVIWKVTNDISGLPSNVKTVKWCPQQDVLAHNNTKLFISQGGISSLQESLYHGVPVLVMPLSFDQPTNARIAAKNGYGTYLRFTNFTEENFLYEINRILSNKRFENRARQISTLLKDGQNKTAETLKWWIKYIIQYKGNPMNNFKANEDYYHWARWIETDIIVFLIFFVGFLLIVLQKLCLKTRNSISYRKNKNI